MGPCNRGGGGIDRTASAAMLVTHSLPSSHENQVTGSLAIFRRIAIACAILLAVSWVYLRMFRGFMPWDDEGLLMFEVRYLLHGHRLYDEIYAQYGPFYYLVQWLYYKGIAQPVSHDAARFLAALLWLGCSSLLAWCTRKLTRSWILTGFAFLAILRTLSSFTEAPGHPEELCLLLACCVLMVSLSVGAAVTVREGAFFGFLVAALTLTKVNIGFYISLALLLALVKLISSRPLRTALYWTTGLLSITAVVAIMFPLIQLSWDRSYCLMVVFAMLATFIVLSAIPMNLVVDSRVWGSMILVGVASGLLILLPFLLGGTSLPAFLWMTIFEYKDFARHWYFALPAGNTTLLYSAASLALAMIWVWSRRVGKVHEKLCFFLQMLKGAVGIFALAATGVRGNPFLVRASVFEALTPLLWLLLLTPERNWTGRTTFDRVALCLVSIYLAMYAFPVAGSQISLALAVMLVPGAVFVHDAWLTVARDRRLRRPRLRRVAATCLLLLLGAVFVRRAATALGEYRARVPLDLPGAVWVRVQPEERDTYHWITRNLQGGCDTFFSMPGLLSLYFWTAENPPKLLLAGDWVGLFNDSQQQMVADSLSRYKRACIIYNPSLVEFWRRGEDLTKSPLARYIMTNFASVGEHRGYYFMMRKAP